MFRRYASSNAPPSLIIAIAPHSIGIMRDQPTNSNPFSASANRFWKFAGYSTIINLLYFVLELEYFTLHDLPLRNDKQNDARFSDSSS